VRVKQWGEDIWLSSFYYCSKRGSFLGYLCRASVERTNLFFLHPYLLVLHFFTSSLLFICGMYTRALVSGGCGSFQAGSGAQRSSRERESHHQGRRAFLQLRIYRGWHAPGTKSGGFVACGFLRIRRWGKFKQHLEHLKMKMRRKNRCMWCWYTTWNSAAHDDSNAIRYLPSLVNSFSGLFLPRCSSSAWRKGSSGVWRRVRRRNAGRKWATSSTRACFPSCPDFKSRSIRLKSIVSYGVDAKSAF